VVGDVNLSAFDALVRLCVEFGKLRHGTGGDDPDAAAGTPDAGAPGTARSRDALVLAIIGQAVELLSGPGGLASFLRRRELDARLAGPSLPLDIGYSKSVPAHIRKAVRLRARHCEWAGGCNQPASACEVHHTKHKVNGGPTSLTGCVLLCRFHHQVMIHRRGWTLVVNPDGTTTAWNKDRTKVLRSHGPPARAG
jgi:5-methylcytosine-specific restriction endonuclease McrA